MSAHTPGPWTKHPGAFEGWAIFGKDASAPLAKVHIYSRKEALANASLIAAAPELLAAAKFAWSELAGSDKNVEADLRRAIDKAEGKAAGRE